jgi:hypothetical protein
MPEILASDKKIIGRNPPCISISRVNLTHSPIVAVESLSAGDGGRVLTYSNPFRKFPSSEGWRQSRRGGLPASNCEDNS